MRASSGLRDRPRLKRPPDVNYVIYLPVISCQPERTLPTVNIRGSSSLSLGILTRTESVDFTLMTKVRLSVLS